VINSLSDNPICKRSINFRYKTLNNYTNSTHKPDLVQIYRCYSITLTICVWSTTNNIIIIIIIITVPIQSTHTHTHTRPYYYF